MEAGWLSRVEALYHGYIHTAGELEMNRPLGAGLFGLTPGPADDPPRHQALRPVSWKNC